MGLAGDAPKRYDEVDFTLPTAMVVGAEGAGLRRLVRERCDWLVSIPMQGHVQSLNVSVAAGIVLFEAVRQRSAPKMSTMGGCAHSVADSSMVQASHGLARVARDVLKFTFCLAGVAQSGRAADL